MVALPQAQIQSVHAHILSHNQAQARLEKNLKRDHNKLKLELKTVQVLPISSAHTRKKHLNLDQAAAMLVKVAANDKVEARIAQEIIALDLKTLKDPLSVDLNTFLINLL